MGTQLIPGAHGKLVSFRSSSLALKRDWKANPRDPKSRLVMVSFRICQAMMGDLRKPRVVSFPFIVAHRVLTEWVLGIELRPKTQIGPGLSIFHGVGLVVNDHCVIGQNVNLRNGVTIGHSRPGGAAPILGDGVDVGANATVIGPITVGHYAVIGAGAVVVKSVPDRVTVVGNPARWLPLAPILGDTPEGDRARE